MQAPIPNQTDRINDQKTEPRIALLKRFLDRLLSQPEASARVEDADRQTAAELGLADGQSGMQGGDMEHAELIEATRRAIRELEPLRPADQSLETMSAPPAQPAAVP